MNSSKPLKREPNIVHYEWHFYWDTMTQWNRRLDMFYTIRYNEDKDRIEFFEQLEWRDYSGDNIPIIQSYKQFQQEIEEILLIRDVRG